MGKSVNSIGYTAGNSLDNVVLYNNSKLTGGSDGTETRSNYGNVERHEW